MQFCTDHESVALALQALRMSIGIVFGTLSDQIKFESENNNWFSAYKPEILEAAEEVEVVEGQMAVLTCKFFASPNANITWESPVLAGIPHTVEPANAFGIGKLLIQSIEFEFYNSNWLIAI